MLHNICIFDQDGTLYPKTSPLGLELSRRTKEWLCKRGNMTDTDFQKFKQKFPDFHEGLLFIGLNLEKWQDEVQKSMLEDIDMLLMKDHDLIHLIKSIEHTYVVTFSCDAFSEKVLNILGISTLLNARFSLIRPCKGEIYKSIQQKHQSHPSNILVFGDNYIADLQPAVNLGMNILEVDGRVPICKQLKIL